MAVAAAVEEQNESPAAALFARVARYCLTISTDWFFLFNYTYIDVEAPTCIMTGHLYYIIFGEMFVANLVIAPPDRRRIMEWNGSKLPFSCVWARGLHAAAGWYWEENPKCINLNLNSSQTRIDFLQRAPGATRVTQLMRARISQGKQTSNNRLLLKCHSRGKKQHEWNIN